MQKTLPIRTRALVPGEQTPCRFFARGLCNKGAQCSFSHAVRGQAPEVPDTDNSVQSTGDSRSQVPCAFFARGACRNGTGCAYAHEADTDATQQAGVEDTVAEIETQDSDTWIRRLGGALIQFEAGAAVSKMSLPSDFSSVRINRLPRDSSVESVKALMEDLGFTSRLESVRILPSPTDALHCSVVVKMEDPRFAKAFCSKTALLTSREIEAIPIPVSGAQDLNSHRVDCRKVSFSWHRPAKLAWMNFGSEDIASKVQRRFASGAFTVLDQRVDVSLPSGSNRKYSPLSWTVTLSSVPVAATEVAIRATIPRMLQPRNVNIGRPSYNSDGATACAVVKSMVQQIGPLEWWQDSLDSGGKRAKAQARFLDDADAREAARVLNNASLPFSATAKLTVQLVTSAKFRVSSRIYDAVRSRIEVQRRNWDAKYLRFTPYAPTKGFRILKIEGVQTKDVTSAAATLEKILAGDIVMQDNKPVWSSSLAFNGNIYQRLKDLGQENDVVIMRNKRKSLLKLFGPEERCRQVAQLVTGILQEDATSDFTIKLTPAQLQWARRGGFRHLSVHLGSNIVALDNIFNPRCIYITGSEDDYCRAKEFIEFQDAGSSTDAGEESDCCVCWTTAEQPVHTQCGHVYCGECFDNCCQSYSSVGASEFRISCKGDGDKCRTVFPLIELEDNLPTDSMEELLEASFKSYVSQNPLRFRYCPTPDCEYVYRVDTGGMHTCLKCQAIICTKCHSSHDGLTCSEYRDYASGHADANRRLMRELNIKECPECKTAIEKTEGCNHMTCPGCHIHICWNCLATFSTSGLCYAHLTKMHDGAFDANYGLDG